MDRIIPYEGDGNYIFISYSHRDIDQVTRLMQHLQQDGFHVWYDEGIEPGTDWSENIARHMQNATLILAVGTQNYVDSNNCRQEIEFAISENRSVLVIWLESAELPAGLKMRLSATQSIFRENFKSEDAFFHKMYKSATMQQCRDQDLAADQKNTETDKTLSPEIISTAEQTENDQDKNQRQKSTVPGKTDQNKKVRKASGSSKKVTVKRVMAAIAGMAAVIALCIIWCNTNSNITIAGTRYERDTQSLKLEDLDLTRKDLNSIRRLDQLKTLYLVNCGLDNEDLAVINFVKMKGLSDLSLENNSELTEIGPLEAAADHLVSIDLDGTQVTDLAPVISGQKLVEISVRNTGLQDLTQISQNTGLRFINAADNEISSLQPLLSLTQLEGLNVDRNPLTDLSGLENAIYLKYLYAREDGISSLEPAGNCTLLKEVDLGGTAVSDISILHKSAPELTALYLDGTKAGAGYIVQLCLACPKLKYLNVDHTNVSDLSFMERLPELIAVSADGNMVKKLPDLTKTQKLDRLSVSDNKLESIMIPKLSNGLSYFLCSNNNIGTFKTNETIMCLDARNNPCTVYTSLGKAYMGQSFITYQPGIPTTGYLLNYYLIDCPKDQIVAMEKAGYQLSDESQAEEETRAWKDEFFQKRLD